jgi:YggT family protein
MLLLQQRAQGGSVAAASRPTPTPTRTLAGGACGHRAPKASSALGPGRTSASTSAAPAARASARAPAPAASPTTRTTTTAAAAAASSAAAALLPFLLPYALPLAALAASSSDPAAADAALSALPAAQLEAVLRPLITAATLLCIVRIPMTWYPALDGTKLPWSLAFAPTEVFLAPTRRVVPPVGGVDVTPIVWVAVLSFASEILLGPQGLLILVQRQQAAIGAAAGGMGGGGAM